MAIDLRRAFFTRGMKLLQHPTVVRVLGSPYAMDVFVAAVRAKERAEDGLLLLRARLLHGLGLATADEIADLKIVIRDLERKVRARQTDER